MVSTVHFPLRIASERGKIISDSFLMVKCAESRQTVEVINKFCRPKQLNHVAKQAVYNLDNGVKAIMYDSSCLDPVLQHAHRDVANDQTQKTSHSHKTGVLEVITIHFNVVLKQALSKSTVNCP